MRIRGFLPIPPESAILNGLARQKINTRLINRNWEDIIRIMGSLLYGTITPSELIRSLLRGKRPSTLARAIRELGRIQRTLYLLNYVDDPDYRRRILTQLSRGEERWGVARTICFARSGEIRKRYKEGAERSTRRSWPRAKCFCALADTIHESGVANTT